MSNIANKELCLCLNNQWKRVGKKTVKDAVIALCGSGAFNGDGKPTDLALDIEYELDEVGNPDLKKQPLLVNPVTWTEWIKLPVRPWDLFISTPNRKIRVPTVIVSVNFAKMPIKKFNKKPTKSTVWHRDQGIDQYTGKKLHKDDASLDHVVPVSRGGSTDDWRNVVLCDKTLNTKKGNKLNNEIGYKLIREPIAPTPMPMYKLIVDAKHRDWELFMKDK